MALCTVLVVDDDPLQRLVLGILLTDQGYQVVTAKHGAQALDLVASDRPDLIVLDVQMPVMDGPSFAQAYAETPLPHAPIIVVSLDPDAAGPWSAPPPAAVVQKSGPLPQLLTVIAAVLAALP